MGRASTKSNKNRYQLVREELGLSEKKQASFWKRSRRSALRRSKAENPSPIPTRC